jgi:hypothetical protein
MTVGVSALCRPELVLVHCWWPPRHNVGCVKAMHACVPACFCHTLSAHGCLCRRLLEFFDGEYNGTSVYKHRKEPCGQPCGWPWGTNRD